MENHKILEEMYTSRKKRNQRKETPVQREKDYDEITWSSGEIYIKSWVCFVVFAMAILLLGLFFYYMAINIGNKANRGMIIMIGSLVIKICFELLIISRKRFLPQEASMHYQQQFISYYEARRYIHFTVTPLFLFTYIYGFVMLLSVF